MPGTKRDQPDTVVVRRVDPSDDFEAIGRLFKQCVTGEYVSHFELQSDRTNEGFVLRDDIDQNVEREVLEIATGLDQGRAAWVALLRQEFVGLCIGAIGHCGNKVWGVVEDIVVRAEFRKGGVAFKLMSTAESYFRQRGAQAVFAESSRNNERSHALAKCLGYIPVSIVLMKRF